MENDKLKEDVKRKNREKSLRYYYRNKEKMRLISKARYKKDKKKILEANKEWCKNNREKRRAHRKKYYEKHKKEIMQKYKKYAKENPDVNRRATKKWRENNLEKAKKLIACWSKNNREKLSFSRRQRTYRKKANGYEKITKKDWDGLVEIFENKCFYCGKKDIKLTMDHYIPLSKGGSHTFENIVPACTSCNCQKGASTPQEWAIRKLKNKAHDRKKLAEK